MMTINQGVCKGCGAAILWIKNENGRPEPFDAKPTRVLHVEGDPQPGGSRFGVAATGEKWASPAGEWELDCAHLPHFVTCPVASKFKKPKETTA